MSLVRRKEERGGEGGGGREGKEGERREERGRGGGGGESMGERKRVEGGERVEEEEEREEGWKRTQKSNSQACHVHLLKESVSELVTNSEHSVPKLTPWLSCLSSSSYLLQQFCQDLP